MDTTDESWLPVRGWEGLYEVSDMGRVKSVPRRIPMPNDRVRRIPERIRAHTFLPNGYRQVQLYREGAAKAYLVHRLVLDSFAGPCPPGAEACHANGVRSDNRLINLRWDTREANRMDALAAGTSTESRTSCPHGHAYTPANTIVRPGGSRACRACSRRRGREAYRARKAGETLSRCFACSSPVARPARGRPPKWCSDQCRLDTQNAARRTKYLEARAKEKP